MGRRGPPPLPREVKELRGTLRKHREARMPVRAPPGDPLMPRHLGPIARAKWKELLPQLRDRGTLSLADRTSLEMLCSAYEEYREAAAAIRKDGGPRVVLTISRGRGKNKKEVRVIKAHPAAATRADAWRRYMVAMREFGLSPAARSRVDGGIPPTPPGASAPPAPSPPVPREGSGNPGKASAPPPPPPPPSRSRLPDDADPLGPWLPSN